MTNIKTLEKTDFKDFQRPDGRELIFIPKEEFLEWYKASKGVDEDVEMIKNSSGNYQECSTVKAQLKSMS